MTENPYYATLEALPDLPRVIGQAVEYTRPHPSGSSNYVLTKVSASEWRVTRDAPVAGEGVLVQDSAEGFTFEGRSRMGNVFGSDASWRFLLQKMF
jgi:hypothetical protein